MKPENNTQQHLEHSYHISNAIDHAHPTEYADHNYATLPQVDHVNLELHYADDISKVTSDYAEIQYMKERIAEKLAEGGLILNAGKTEEYTISRLNCDSSWKKCKLLGSLLDTEEDMKRRKGLTIDAVMKLRHIFNHKKISITTKLKVFNCHVEPIYLYNSELWVLTKQCRDSIDSFHRRILRSKILNIRYPRTVTNVEVYNKTGAKKWSTSIERRRLCLFGHTVRQREDTPVRKALAYARRPYDRPAGRPRTTWLSQITGQIAAQMNMSLEDAVTAAQDREVWKSLCG